jgi:hypothetical protein
MARPKNLRVRLEGRHRASPGLLSSREVTGAARLQPAPAAMSSLSRTWRTSRRCSPSLLSGLAGDAETDAAGKAPDACCSMHRKTASCDRRGEVSGRPGRAAPKPARRLDMACTRSLQDQEEGLETSVKRPGRDKSCAPVSARMGSDGAGQPGAMLGSCRYRVRVLVAG